MLPSAWNGTWKGSIMPGPLPDPHSINRNKKLPTTDLPMSGVPVEQRPNPPAHAKLGAKGKAFWLWAWGLPQASAWVNGGMEDAVARRAQLEDWEPVDEKDLNARERHRQMQSKALGITPDGFAHLRWRIVSDITEDGLADEITQRREARRAEMKAAGG